MKYYVSADVHRDATPQEIAEISVPNACIHLYMVKTIVEAENVPDAIAKGTETISASLDPGCKATRFGAMPMHDARKLREEEI